MLKNLRFVLAPTLIVSLLAPYFAIAALPPTSSDLPPKENLLQFQLNKPFGGKITKIQACQSPPGLILHIGPPSGGQYFFDPASTILHQYKVVKPGVWTLGLAQPVTKTCVGNPAGVGGFSAGGIAGQGLSSISITPLSDGYGGISGVEISSSFSNTVVDVGGELGQTLAEFAQFIPYLQIAYLIYSVYKLISYLKKPPTLGPAYPIIRIGTGLAPAPAISTP